MRVKEERALTTKVIAGKFKNRIIELPSLDTTRSSKSILRESLFNRLQFEIVDSNFIELFAGSGSIGIEALSRGAKWAYFFEKSESSFRVLKSNLKNLEIDSATAILGDSFERIYEIIDLLESKNEKTYLYIDPPFSIRNGMEDIYQRCFELVSNLNIDTLEEVIFEHMSSFNMPDNLKNGLILTKQKKFGKSSLSYYSNRNC